MKKKNEIMPWTVIWKKAEQGPEDRQKFIDMWDVTFLEHFAKHVINPEEKWNEIFGCEIAYDIDLAGVVVVFKEKRNLKKFAEICFKFNTSAYRCWQRLKFEIGISKLNSEKPLAFEAVKKRLFRDKINLDNCFGEKCCGFSIKNALETFDQTGGGIKAIHEAFCSSIAPAYILEQYRMATRKTVAWTGKRPRHAEFFNYENRVTITGVDDKAIRFISTPDKNSPTASRILTAFRANVGINSFEKERETIDLFCAKRWGSNIREKHNARLYTPGNWGI